MCACNGEIKFFFFTYVGRRYAKRYTYAGIMHAQLFAEMCPASPNIPHRWITVSPITIQVPLPVFFFLQMAPYSPHPCVHMVPVIGKFGYDPHTVRQLRYKTELCRDFQWGQFCPHGSKCWFAHGTHELRRRPVIVPAKKSSIASVILYKTQQCKKWREDGACRRSMM
jgi:hypothetical protein